MKDAEGGKERGRRKEMQRRRKKRKRGEGEEEMKGTVWDPPC